MILRAAWVVPVSSPPIRDGYVEISGDRIVAVGRWPRSSVGLLSPTPERQPSSDSEVRRYGQAGDIVDLGDAILTPGLVNPHTHLELTCYAGQIPPGPFWPWLAKLVQLRRQPGQIERETQAVIDGAWQSLRAGVTCVGDISRRNLAWRSLKPLPIRKVCFVELLSIADDPPRNPRELDEAADEIEEDELLHYGYSPHAPWSVPATEVEEVKFISLVNKRPWMMHLAETPEELAYLRGDVGALPPAIQALLTQRGIQSPRMSLTEYLRDVCGDESVGALVHLNYLEPGDIETLAAQGHVAVYCPRAHQFFGHKAHPFAAMQRAGIPVAIGTDSAASGATLSPLDELNMVAQRVAGSPPAAQLFEMVTLTAARALRKRHVIGSLEAGKLADLAAFACPPETADPLALLIHNPASALAVWVAGRRVEFP